MLFNVMIIRPQNYNHPNLSLNFTYKKKIYRKIRKMRFFVNFLNLPKRYFRNDNRNTNYIHINLLLKVTKK
jgi:hypothetical protein